MSVVSVTYTCGCIRCGSVNIKTEKKLDKEQFEKFAQQDPTAYWKEDRPSGVLYRQHEENRHGNCRTSC